MKKILSFLVAVMVFHSAMAQKNIIVIIADDLGADYCGFTDNATDTAKMPNIRGLLQKGVRFKNAWGTPYCSSTRAGIFTGRYSFRTGVGTVIGGATSAELDTTEISIAELLKYSAPTKYATANIGKWHMNLQTPQKILYPTTVFGYDLFKGNFLGGISSYTNWTKITNGVQTDTITNYATTETVNDAISWLDTIQNNKPFFLWLAFNAPHTPFHQPPANLHSVAGLTGTQQHINQNPALYFKAMIEAMDTEAGRLFQWLTNNNKMDSTIIIFTGDNGNDKRVRQIADSTHVKGTVYDYGVHVPFLISGPGIVNPNRSSDALINVQDIFATVLETAGFTNWAASIPNGTTIDSKSILPILKNQNNSIRDWAFTELFTPTPTAKDGKTMRNVDYQLIRFDNGNQEFYNLITDPLQQTNLLSQNLSANELSNYNYLCNEMTNLVGTPFCQAGVGIQETLHEKSFIEILNLGNKLSFVSETAFEISIFDIQGKLMDMQIFAAGNHIMDIRNYANGIYLVEAKKGNEKITKKILKD
jgi:arylsulfatase B